MGKEKINSQGKRGPYLKASRHQATTPYFSSSTGQPNPISIQGDKKKTPKPKKTHATHSHALVGNQEKFICVNRSNREQQNPPAYSQDTLESGMRTVKVSEDSQKGREDAFAGKSAGQRREPVARKGIFCTEERWSLSPTPYLARPKNKLGT